MPTRTSEKIIEDLIIAVYGPAPEPRRQYQLAQSLHALVRLAKTEQLRELKADVERAAGAAAGSGSRRETRTILRKIGMNCNARQGQFQFDKEDSARSE
ncbi:hypothetical protein [Janthinobacterium fluminis]|uniref:Uncharacterized protein n=1 Tax=Janthinobacterium fluminis TaxID=2987524 RepID=A0ABT5JX87_9BURK|nr:hypothetical protein [Janthinobacterium fluminis]MDC8757359.1 hypothetical protein [Janthinobacterium fluminis]